MWQTRIVRETRLKVMDEVANGLSYYDYTFLRELPRLYGELEDALGAADPAWKSVELPSFFRMGSWIGGDRDGNPFVTAEALRGALHRQSEDGRWRSISRSCMRSAPSCRCIRGWSASPTKCWRWPSTSPDNSPHRQDEPYRRAISGLYARLAATCPPLGHHRCGAAHD